MTMPVQSAPAYQNRNEAFGQGQNGVSASPGLQQDQQAMNSGGPAKVKMSGSANGISADQSSATMGGTLPTANGQSDSSFEQKKWFEPRP